MLPDRPHPTPCACQDCLEWARAVMATPTPRKPKPPTGEPPIAPEMPLADFARRMMDIACKATGMTEAELRARAEREDIEAPPIVRERASREAVGGRRVPEIHLCSVYDREPVECDALTAVRALLDGDKAILVLAGGVGTRKTGSACWALTQKPGVFCTAEELVQASYTRNEDDAARWQRIRTGQVLVIDDLGGEYVDDKGWSTRTINGIVDYRYSNKLKTIITTNLDIPRFKSSYGDRVADRIREAGKWVAIRGESVRGRSTGT